MTIEEQDPAKIAPLLWNAYKDILNEEDLANLKGVIVNPPAKCNFEDSDNLVDAFKWGYTKQGYSYWSKIEKSVCEGTYKKQSSVAVESVVEPLCSIQYEESTNVCLDGVPIQDWPEQKTSATDFLRRAAELQDARAAEYDQEGGERSAGKIAQAFNAITGHNLSEQDVWMLLVVLKQVRFYNNPAKKHRDSVEDLVSYAALFAESVFKHEA